MMVLSMPEYYNWITVDEHGTINGVRDDAPDYIKEQYRKDCEYRAMMRAKGVLC